MPPSKERGNDNRVRGTAERYGVFRRIAVPARTAGVLLLCFLPAIVTSIRCEMKITDGARSLT